MAARFGDYRAGRFGRKLELVIALAANGYQDLYTLLDAGEVPIDYIKCPLSPDGRAEVARARGYRPVVLHCWGPAGYSATWPEIPEPEVLAEVAESSGTPFLSVHLDHQQDRDGAMDQGVLIAHVRGQVAELRRISGKEVLLENVPWYPWRQDRPRWGTDPSFITEAVVCSEAFFLIDIAHARVAAWHRGESVEGYLAALPLDRAWEVHVSGPRMSGEGLRDRHMSLAAEDYELLDFVLQRAPEVRLITTEYAGRREGKTSQYGESDGPEKLAEEIGRLDAMRRGLA